MDIDVEALLAPVSEDNPVGEDLDGTPERYAIEEPFQLEQGAEEGSELEIDWRGAARRIVAQFADTKDLWLGVYLMRAGARMGDLDAVVGGARLGQGMVERYWATVHPQLEMVDFVGRKTPFESLTKLRDFLNPLKQVILIQHPRLGRYSIADVQRMEREGPSADGYGMFQAALADMGAGGVNEVRDKVDSLIAAVRATDAVLTANSGSETSTNFNATYDALDEMRAALDAFAEAEPEPVTDGGGDDELNLDDLDLGDLDLGDLNLDDLGLGDLDLSDGAGSEAAAGGDDLDLGDLDLGDLDSLLSDGGGAAPAPPPSPPRPPRSTAAGAVRRPGGPITSRGEALAAIQAAESYYRAQEPSSPVAALLERARNWAAMDFMELMTDLSPDSLTDVRRVLGVKSEGY